MSYIGANKADDLTVGGRTVEERTVEERKPKATLDPL